MGAPLKSGDAIVEINCAKCGLVNARIENGRYIDYTCVCDAEAAQNRLPPPFCDKAVARVEYTGHPLVRDPMQRVHLHGAAADIASLIVTAVRVHPHADVRIIHDQKIKDAISRPFHPAEDEDPGPSLQALAEPAGILVVLLGVTNQKWASLPAAIEDVFAYRLGRPLWMVTMAEIQTEKKPCWSADVERKLERLMQYSLSEAKPAEPKPAKVAKVVAGQRTMPAKFDQTCGRCGGPIEKGDPVIWEAALTRPGGLKPGCCVHPGCTGVAL